ncbi:hypothetical protein AVEN_98972-1 [Araneus ventricosus]|uniref:Uncharacterized protein n=1 Tax=Araneus ventricosus TaxID=182803 RepID=A0A4Y2M539_ARAVE|nr:hypothetical protein AVEN_98972-1 [Araneus ventricosus]
MLQHPLGKQVSTGYKETASLKIHVMGPPANQLNCWRNDASSGVVSPLERGSSKLRGPCRTLELYSRRKALVNISWRHPPAHSWHRCEGPGVTMHFEGDRKDQTALARLSFGHLKTFRFSRGDKKLNICTKCNMIEATPQHLLDCVALVYDDLLKRPDFVLEVMRADDLMDLI